MRQWTKEAGLSCFYFEAFDEPWKDADNPLGSENHFGLITINNEVKYVLWDAFDKGVLDKLTRNSKPLKKSNNGDEIELLKKVTIPTNKKSN